MPTRQLVAKELAEIFKIIAHPDRVRIIESRPISSRKRWRVIEVVTSQARLEGAPAGETADQDQRDESNQVGA